LQVETDQAFLTKVYNEYVTAKQRGDSYQSGVSFSIPTKIGSLGLNDNHESVTSMYEYHKNIGSYLLSNDERYVLSQMFTNPADAQDARKRFIECIEVTQNMSFLRVAFQNETSVVINFKLNAEEVDSATIRSLIFSDNLKLESDNIEGKTIPRRGMHSLKFKRTDTRKAYVQVNLQRGNVSPLDIPQVGAPVYKEEIVPEQRDYSLTADVARKYLRIRNQNSQTQTFNNFVVDPLYGGFALPGIDFIYETEYSNTEARVKKITYNAITGGISEFDDKDIVILPGGKIGVLIHISPNSSNMTGTIRILFDRKTRNCTANCPE
jgi:hypothetical protein